MCSPAKTRYQYRVCGLYLESDMLFSLPQAVPQSVPDIKFRLKGVGRSTDAIFPKRAPIGKIKNGAGYPSITVCQVDHGLLLDCHNTHRRVEFVMPRDGRWIDCYAHSETTAEDIELWLFGLVISFILQSRGIFSLHAAAVNIGGNAVAFLGTNGCGKSTLAYFLARNGHALITDDVLALVDHQGWVSALPGSPSMNLWNQTLDHLGWPDASSKTGGAGKHRYGIDQLGFCRNESAVPLQNVYFLRPTPPDEAQTVRSESVAAAEAMVDLLSYTRANSMIEISKQKDLLKIYSLLISQASMRRLNYPRECEYLKTVYQTILEDAEGWLREKRRSETNDPPTLSERQRHV